MNENIKIGYITGDGIGIDITPVAIKVIDAAISKAYGNEKTLEWQEIIVGEKASQQGLDLIPHSALEKIKELKLVLKGPLTTPIGKGYRSLNVSLRQILNLYAAIRPVRYFSGLPAPVKNPEDVDMVIFRENTEDVYSGIEWPSKSQDAIEIIEFIEKKGKKINPDSGIGIKPISPQATKRIIKEAVEFAIKNNRKVVTLVHKGNIMKFTEGAFKDWGYQFIKENYNDRVIFEEDIENNNIPNGKILINNRIADAMFQQILLRPREYDVIATMNLNGDYLSDALAAQVGGLGIAPSANLGDSIGIFEATHGTAPKYAGQNKVNPTSLILSGVMMLENMKWGKAAGIIIKALEKTFLSKKVTYDLHRQMPDATLLSTSEFGDEIIKNIKHG